MYCIKLFMYGVSFNKIGTAINESLLDYSAGVGAGPGAGPGAAAGGMRTASMMCTTACGQISR